VVRFIFFIYSRALNNNVISNGISHCCNYTFTDDQFTSLLAKNIEEECKLFYAMRISISLAILFEILIQIGYFLSRVSILTRDIDIANLSASVRPSACLSVTLRYQTKTA